MAWTAPPTFVSGNVLTAAQMNILSGDLNQTAAAVATTAGRFIVTTGANSVAERIPVVASTANNEGTSSATYATLTTNVNVTATTGSQAIIFITVANQSTTASNNMYTSYRVSGASNILPADNSAVIYAAANTTTTNRMGITHMDVTLTAGSNTWGLWYRCSAGGGNFLWRHLCVIPL